MSVTNKNAPPVRQMSATVRRQAAFLLWMANLVLAIVVGVNYLAHVPAVDTGSAKMWIFALPALVSTALILTFVPGVLFTVSAHFVKSTRVLGLVQSGFWIFFLTLGFADTRVYNMFRYHMGGQVWNLVTVRASEDAIHLGWQVYTAITAGLTIGMVVQLWIWKRAVRRALLQETLSTSRRVLLRPSFVVGLVLLPVVFIEKTIYAQADLGRDRQITHLARLFPLYARVPMEDFKNKVLGVELARDPRPPRIESEGIALDYPHARPAMDPAGARPNIVIVMIDCLRQDRLSEVYTPNVTRFAGESLRFENHLSGGNSTRFGIFSLLYGLYGSYWAPVLAERRSPVLIDTLQELGYEFGIFSSTSMNYPELRETAWSRIAEDVHDDFPAELPWRRDILAADAMIAWLQEVEDDEAPFFGFILLDSPHQTYSHPPDVAPFQPSALEIDYMSVTQNEGPDPETLEAMRNRYNNAVHHADVVTGSILDQLERSTSFENTIVIVTSDHGEEFLECGFFGHTSAFTPQQVAVPLIMRGPGIQPGVETAPTSHLDIAPTLLEILGANPLGRESWCLGANLFDPATERDRVVSGWNELGVWTSEAILRVPLSAFEFDVEAYDYQWRLIVDDFAVLDTEVETLEQLGADCNRFLR
jgi:membrane-anchored protein YejM (alkaline phosphatase superfamily)